MQFKVMTTLVEQIITRMGLHDEPSVLSKTNELLRLLELRAISVPLQLNEYAKVLLCADIAATLLGIAFDKEQALRISNLRKSHYANSKRMVEKLLDLNKVVGVNDICVQLNLAEISYKANELLELYKSSIADESHEEDFIHPQYAAMAVYSACKLSKQKVAKPKLMSFSNLRPTQWQQLEQRWDKFMAKHYKEAMNKKHQDKSMETGKKAQADNASNEKNRASVIKHKGAEVEDYEKWKQRMLTMAESQLKLEQSKKEQMNKENFQNMAY